MFRPRLRIPRVPRVGLSQPLSRRWKHHIPTLNYDIKDGIPRFLSPPAVGIAWSDYMTLMIEKLNNMTAGMWWFYISYLRTSRALSNFVGLV